MKLTLEDYINKVRWQKAKDCTHEYTVVSWKPELEKEFRELVSLIYKEGFKEKFQRSTYTYLTINGYRYWTMNYRVEVTILINRQAVSANF